MNRIGKYEGVVRLVLLLVVLPAAVYRLSLGRTVALWGEVRRTERTLAETDSASIQPDASVVMLDTVELIAGGGLLDLLERLDPDSSVRIVSYTPYLTRKGDDFTLRTAEIVLSGGFVPAAAGSSTRRSGNSPAAVCFLRGSRRSGGDGRPRCC